MAQRVGTDLTRQTERPHIAVQTAGNTAGRQPPSRTIQEQRPLLGPPTFFRRPSQPQEFFSVDQVLLERLPGLVSERDDSFLASFSPDPQDLQVNLHVLHAQPHELTHPQAASVQELQHRPIPCPDERVVSGCIQDPKDIVHGQEVGQHLLPLRHGQQGSRVGHHLALEKKKPIEAPQGRKLPGQRSLPVLCKSARQESSDHVVVSRLSG